jgi:hypothetical protein
MNLSRPKLDIEVFEIPKEHKEDFWNLFKKHHYLTGKLNKAARCYVAYLWGEPVAFNSILRQPCGSVPNMWRGHRLVVLSDYQGMGLGSSLSECIGDMVIRDGGRYFCKTANIKLGEYRNDSDKWRPTSKNGKARPDQLSSKRKNYQNIIDKRLSMRICYSHEYIQSTNDQ